MRIFCLLAWVLFTQAIFGQELFVMSDPASNLPKDALAVNVMQTLSKDRQNQSYHYGISPEISYGFTKDFMMRASSFVHQSKSDLALEAASLMAKYRFYSEDDFHRHFRSAVFARYNYGKKSILQSHAQDFKNINNSLELGLIATKLIHKLALSSSVNFEKSIQNKPNTDAINYSLSSGYLIYPSKYNSYNDTNINLMLELIGHIKTNGKENYSDLVPSIQFIFDSQIRVDLAYRHQLASAADRLAYQGFYLNFYYLFFS